MAHGSELDYFELGVEMNEANSVFALLHSWFLPSTPANCSSYLCRNKRAPMRVAGLDRRSNGGDRLHATDPPVGFPVRSSTRAAPATPASEAASGQSAASAPDEWRPAAAGADVGTSTEPELALAGGPQESQGPLVAPGVPTSQGAPGPQLEPASDVPSPPIAAPAPPTPDYSLRAPAGNEAHRTGRDAKRRNAQRLAVHLAQAGAQDGLQDNNGVTRSTGQDGEGGIPAGCSGALDMWALAPEKMHRSESPPPARINCPTRSGSSTATADTVTACLDAPSERCPRGDGPWDRSGADGGQPQPQPCCPASGAGPQMASSDASCASPLDTNLRTVGSGHIPAAACAAGQRAGVCVSLAVGPIAAAAGRRFSCGGPCENAAVDPARGGAHLTDFAASNGSSARVGASTSGLAAGTMASFEGRSAASDGSLAETPQHIVAAPGKRATAATDADASAFGGASGVASCKLLGQTCAAGAQALSASRQAAPYPAGEHQPGAHSADVVDSASAIQGPQMLPSVSRRRRTAGNPAVGLPSVVEAGFGGAGDSLQPSLDGLNEGGVPTFADLGSPGWRDPGVLDGAAYVVAPALQRRTPTQPRDPSPSLQGPQGQEPCFPPEEREHLMQVQVGLDEPASRSQEDQQAHGQDRQCPRVCSAAGLSHPRGGNDKHGTHTGDWQPSRQPGPGVQAACLLARTELGEEPGQYCPDVQAAEVPDVDLQPQSQVPPQLEQRQDQQQEQQDQQRGQEEQEHGQKEHGQEEQEHGQHHPQEQQDLQQQMEVLLAEYSRLRRRHERLRGTFSTELAQREQVIQRQERLLAGLQQKCVLLQRRTGTLLSYMHSLAPDGSSGCLGGDNFDLESVEATMRTGGPHLKSMPMADFGVEAYSSSVSTPGRCGATGPCAGCPTCASWQSVVEQAAGLVSGEAGSARRHNGEPLQVAAAFRGRS